MPYRYCPSCDEWLSIDEYTTGSQGAVVCPQHEETHGFIPEPGRTDTVVIKYGKQSDEYKAAVAQGLGK